MKKIMFAVLAAGLVMGTAGCANAQEMSKYHEEVTVTLKDGRQMPCILYGSGSGSLDCDWGNAK